MSIRRGAGGYDPHRVCIDLNDSDYHALRRIADSPDIDDGFTVDAFCRDAISDAIARFDTVRRKRRARRMRMPVSIVPSLASTDPADTPLEDLHLSESAEIALRSAGVRTVGDLAAVSPRDVMDIRHLDREVYPRIIQSMHARGLIRHEHSE